MLGSLHENMNGFLLLLAVIFASCSISWRRCEAVLDQFEEFIHLKNDLETFNQRANQRIDNLESKLKNDLKTINQQVNQRMENLESKGSRKRKGCQDGTLRVYTYPRKLSTTRWVPFQSPFDSTPSVVTGITFYDNDKEFNDRLHVEITSINKSGFNVKMYGTVVSDTKLYGVGIRWMACPKLFVYKR